MDTSVVVVIIIGLIAVIGGPYVGRLANKASHNAEKEELNKTKSK